MKSSINYLLPLFLATHPVSAAEPDPPANEEVVRLRAEGRQLRAALQALRAQAPKPARMAVDDAPRTTPLPTTQLFAPLADTGGGRRWNVLLEFYDGPSPYGQFYPQDVRYWGIAAQLGL